MWLFLRTVGVFGVVGLFGVSPDGSSEYKKTLLQAAGRWQHLLRRTRSRSSDITIDRTSLTTSVRGRSTQLSVQTAGRWLQHITRQETRKESSYYNLGLCCIITKTGFLTFAFPAVQHATTIACLIAPFSGRCSCGDLSSLLSATDPIHVRSRQDVRKWK